MKTLFERKEIQLRQYELCIGRVKRIQTSRRQTSVKEGMSSTPSVESGFEKLSCNEAYIIIYVIWSLGLDKMPNWVIIIEITDSVASQFFRKLVATGVSYDGLERKEEAFYGIGSNIGEIARDRIYSSSNH
jgi:hypothetical protein